MNITSENYFSIEAEKAYFSNSQFKNFDSCEEAAMARIWGKYATEPSTAMLVGSYVDAHFEGILDVFKAQHPEIMKRDGSLKAEYEHANVIIARIEQHEMLMQYLDGEKQVIKTGEWLGVPWKIKMDVYHPGGAIVDLKIMKDFEPIWVDGQGKIPFVEKWGYDLQGAIYREIEGNNLPFLLVAATKEKPEPNVLPISIPPDALDTAAEIIKSKIDRFTAVKAGKEKPTRCEKCNWCRKTRVLTEFIDYREL
jgi:hypothetical protein